MGKDNGWIGSGSKLATPRIPMCPATPPASPSIRRRSLGVLKTPAWGLRTYRDPDKAENNNSSPSSRRRSLVLPVRYIQGEQSPCSSRRKSLVSPDITDLTGSKDFISNRRLRYGNNFSDLHIKLDYYDSNQRPNNYSQFFNSCFYSNSAEELGKPCNEKQLDFENIAQDKSKFETTFRIQMQQFLEI